jgi:acetyltransferase-like isoleucine patch superfamily enzyme
MWLLRPLFARVGRNVVFDPDGSYSFGTIEIGSDVFIGLGASFSGQQVVIGNKIMFGPRVTILGGDHQYDRPGQFMFDLKAPGRSAPVVIEDDVWVGGGVIVLKGVRIGTGSIVGAGSVVTKDVAPYTVVAGNPARCLRKRFEDPLLELHLKKLQETQKS